MTGTLEKSTSTATEFAQAMLIDGKLVAGEGAPISVINPSSGEVTVTIPGASRDQVAQAIAAARKAFDRGEWSEASPADRLTTLRRLLSLFVERSADLRDLLVIETGTPVKSFVIGAQVDGPLAQMAALLDLYPKLPEVEENPVTLNERVGMSGFVQSIRRHVPVGVVSAISAYNFPVHISLWKIFAPLASGNSVVLRPSPLTPLTALWMAKVATEAGLPDGVLNVVAEAGADGALLMTTDPDVDMVSFTGSTHVGAMVAAQAAPSMKRLQLELGGKSAQIFLPDRVEAAFNSAIGVCMSHAGQGCVLGTRVFVPEADKERVLEKMKASLTGMAKIGDSDDPATTMGPVISEAQVQRCEKYVKSAVDAGATIVTGGKRADRPGFFFEPTILDCPDNSNPAAQDEIFGPVICVIGYRDIDHAVEMANDSPFGLSGYVNGKDSRQALAVAKRIRTGTINVNASMASANSSSGGHKMSGIGRERGVEGIRAFQEIQVMNLGTAV